MTSFHFPEAKVLQYRQSDISRWYELSAAPVGFSIPKDLTIEERQKPETIRAELLLTSRRINGRTPFFTGLRKMGRERFYYGDHFKAGRKNLVLVLVSENNRFLTIWYYRGFYPKGETQRRNFFTEFFRRLDAGGCT